MYHVPGIEGAARAARQPRRHRQGTTADRARRSQSTVAVSVLHRDRPQRARQKPVQRTRRHALVHGLPADTIGAYLDWRTQEVGVAAAPVRRSGADDATIAAATSITHSLGCAASPTTPIRRRWKKRAPRHAPAHEAAAARHQLRDGRAVAGARARSPPADRQRHHRAPPARTIRRSGSGATNMVQRRDAGAPDRKRLRLAAAHQHQPKPAHALQFPHARRRRRDAAAGGVAAVRGRHRADHAHPRRDSAGGDRPEQIEHAKEIMRRPGATSATASRSASTSTSCSKDGARYRDKRPMAQKMWATIMNALEAVGAIPERDVA